MAGPGECNRRSWRVVPHSHNWTSTAVEASGTSIFLFTDLEGSTRLWESEPIRMADALACHDRLCRDVIAAHDGRLVKMMGDGMQAVFGEAPAAVAAIVDLQRRVV